MFPVAADGARVRMLADCDHLLARERVGVEHPDFVIGLVANIERAGGRVRKEDAAVAKNYLTEDELQVLNRIVNLYLEYAELQALERKAMTMRDWITKLDDFLKASGRELLGHAGEISAEAARQKAEMEYERYRMLLDAQPRAVDAAFEKAVKELKKLPARSRKKKQP